jgi:hypothetical protein
MFGLYGTRNLTMFDHNVMRATKAMLAAGVAASILALGTSDILSAQQAQSSAPPAQAATPAGKPATTGAAPVRPGPGLPRRAQMYFQDVWGVDSLKVKYTESGEMIRFSWRVLDATKAAPLNDKAVEPALFDAQAGVSLVVPQMEKVGKLRQSSTPIEGKSYWMAFSNSGRRVRPGDRVIVQIGKFRADWLVVE